MALKLATGFKFSPTDEELLSFYLRQWVTGHPLPPNVVHNCDVYQVEPWRLFDDPQSFEHDSVRYFFTQRRKRYDNGSRPNRKVGGGHWKASGGKKPVLNKQGDVIGATRSLKFVVDEEQVSRPESSGSWIMHEYWFEEDSISKFTEWVVCRVRKDTRGVKRRYTSTRTSTATEPQSPLNIQPLRVEAPTTSGTSQEGYNDLTIPTLEDILKTYWHFTGTV